MSEAQDPKDQPFESERMVRIPEVQIKQAERYLFGGADLIDFYSQGSDTQKEMRTVAAQLAVSRLDHERRNP